MSEPIIGRSHAMLSQPVEVTGYSPNIQKWMTYFETHDHTQLPGMLHDDVVFESPVVYTPQKGKRVTLAYLTAAGETLGSDAFRYVRIFDCGSRAVLEFETVMDGKYVNGVDLIEWDSEGLITEFKVMVRPRQAMQSVHAAMGEMLEQMKG